MLPKFGVRRTVKFARPLTALWAPDQLIAASSLAAFASTITFPMRKSAGAFERALHGRRSDLVDVPCTNGSRLPHLTCEAGINLN
jgi:hypothetical protein